MNKNIVFLMFLTCFTGLFAMEERPSAQYALTPYDFLGLDKTAKPEDITKSYRKLASVIHPDKSKKPMAEECFKAISNAYEVLTNDTVKAYFDKQDWRDWRNPASSTDVDNEITKIHARQEALEVHIRNNPWDLATIMKMTNEACNYYEKYFSRANEEGQKLLKNLVITNRLELAKMMIGTNDTDQQQQAREQLERIRIHATEIQSPFLQEINQLLSRYISSPSPKQKQSSYTDFDLIYTAYESLRFRRTALDKKELEICSQILGVSCRAHIKTIEAACTYLVGLGDLLASNLSPQQVQALQSMRAAKTGTANRSGNMRDPYEILGIRNGSDYKEIDAAYQERRISLYLKLSELKKVSDAYTVTQNEIAQIEEAYRYLRNQKTRNIHEKDTSGSDQKQNINDTIRKYQEQLGKLYGQRANWVTIRKLVDESYEYYSHVPKNDEPFKMIKDHIANNYANLIREGLRLHEFNIGHVIEQGWIKKIIENTESGSANYSYVAMLMREYEHQKNAGSYDKQGFANSNAPEVKDDAQIKKQIVDTINDYQERLDRLFKHNPQNNFESIKKLVNESYNKYEEILETCFDAVLREDQELHIR